MTSMWWIDMFCSVRRSVPSRNVCQWGMARISIVASTGSPSAPRSSSVFDGAHRLVEAHVLVDRQERPAVARLDGSERARVVAGQRLLGEDALDVRPLGGLRDDLGLLVGRERDVEHLDRLVLDEVLPRPVGLRDAVGSPRLRPGPVSGRRSPGR
jgi:hypothetical protein